MIYFLNRGLILEQEVEKAIETYFSLARVPEYYPNYSISVTNDHPFAHMLLSDNPEKDAMSLFPVIVVATEDDRKPTELLQLTDMADTILEQCDIESMGGEKSFIEKRYNMITPKIMEELQTAMNEREDKRFFGTSFYIRRRERISIEIWAENPQLKNELYELVRLFVCGFMKEYLSELYSQYFEELKKDGPNPLTIFDSSVNGQRSNNFNVDFGIELCGAHLTLEADYIIEQTVIDTRIVEQKNILVEVINHVKGYNDTTRERFAVGSGRGRGRKADNKS
jgi:hypothetical protein